MKRVALLLSVIVLLAACARPAPPHVTVHADEFSQEIEVDGVAKFENPFAHYIPHFWRLRSFINKHSHVVYHQAFLYVNYKGSAKNFKFANDDTAALLKITPIYKNNCMGDSCEKTEILGMLLSDAQLRSHEAAGYRIRVRAKSGDTIILTFTPEMIRLQLEAVDKILASSKE